MIQEKSFILICNNIGRYDAHVATFFFRVFGIQKAISKTFYIRIQLFLLLPVHAEVKLFGLKMNDFYFFGYLYAVLIIFTSMHS